MHFSFYLAFRYLFPSKGAPSAFVWVCLLGISLAVAALLTSQSIVDGFGGQLRQRMAQSFGDVRVDRAEESFPYPFALLKDLKADEAVVAVEAYGEGTSMIAHRSRTRFPKLLGLELSDAPRVLDLQGAFTHGALQAHGICLGESTAAALGAVVGSRVEVYVPDSLEKLKDGEITLALPLTVVGIFRTGYRRFDENFALIDLETWQDLYEEDGNISGLALRLKNREEAVSFSEKWEEQLKGQYRVLSWVDAHGSILFALAFEKTMTFVFNLVIVAVSGFAVGGGLYLTILRKRGQIGLLNALGASGQQIAAVFLLMGLFLAGIGCIMGTLLALGLLNYRQALVDLCLRLSSESYLSGFLMEVPVAYRLENFVSCYLWALFFVCLAAVLPSLHAARLKVVEALRDGN